MVNYKKFKIERLDAISPTFCGAKWLMSDFYLYTGTTSSCHLPTPDTIDLNLLNVDINYINNTKEKIEQKRQMLEGKQPSKCSNCWQVENTADSAISERIILSYKFSDRDFTKLNLNIDQKPAVITVAFDTLCNFICSYCDASVSSSWATDLLTNGPYKNILYDSKRTYQRLGKSELVDDYKFIFDKFFEYIVDSLPTTKIIHCVGGEPLISPNFWKFLDQLSKHDTSNVTLNVVTNLSHKKNLQKLLMYEDKFQDIQIYASIDNIGASAEFLRKGLVWDEFEDNIKFVLEQNRFPIRLIATIPGIAVDKMIDFLNWFKNLSDNYTNKITLNIYRLRHPNFQAIQVLPEELKLKYKEELSQWIDKNSDFIPNDLLEQIKNIIIILSTNNDHYENIDITLLQNDAKTYYKEYAQRHNFKLNEIFSKELYYWLNS